MTALIRLTPQERDRFAAWLEQEAATERGLLAQLEKLSGHAAMVQQRKVEMHASLLIARKLRAIEDWSSEPDKPS